MGPRIGERVKFHTFTTTPGFATVCKQIPLHVRRPGLLSTAPLQLCPGYLSVHLARYAARCRTFRLHPPPPCRTTRGRSGLGRALHPPAPQSARGNSRSGAPPRADGRTWWVIQRPFRSGMAAPSESWRIGWSLYWPAELMCGLGETAVKRIV